MKVIKSQLRKCSIGNQLLISLGGTGKRLCSSNESSYSFRSIVEVEQDTAAPNHVPYLENEFQVHNEE